MSRRLRWIAFLAVLATGVTAAVATAQDTEEDRRCYHEGQFHAAGTVLVIDGESMQCDGATGVWVPAAAAE